MAVLKSVFLMVTLFLATSCAAPTSDTEEVLKTPPECVGQRVCSTRPEGYDLLEEKINSLLPEVLLKDYADRNGPETRLEPPKLSPKSDWHNCPYETKTEPWYVYYRGENNTKTEIIVQTKLFQQHVESVVCAYKHIDADSHVQCFQDLGVSDAFGMRSSCVTTTATRTLYVFDVEKNVVIQKPFEVPACCKCRVTYT
ncbi:unnamed protein product [Arctia plantaginis]|uniref:Spaetzle domain-containing protein n=1 Tax=Arctia plantaginis TaxID=874455 RepID=A0A8S0Z2K2_ARCPL|nr:unnamed protein product [Arctia plantaginis]CAB3239194.1 unnamed protein product [Arctia plantaginis]